jgi:hypothetical protein
MYQFTGNEISFPYNIVYASSSSFAHGRYSLTSASSRMINHTDLYIVYSVDVFVRFTLTNILSVLSCIEFMLLKLSNICNRG